MNAVGIDVSKGKSVVSIMCPFGKFLAKPFVVQHNLSSINELILYLKGLKGETKIVMEHTGRYYEPMAKWLTQANLFVSTVNPKLIKNFSNNSLRNVKTDKADSKKIARYTLDRWHELRQYNLMDETRSKLKTMNRQFAFYSKHKTAIINNLIALIDETYPGANDFFDSPARGDGSQKWVDFVATFWHVDIVRSMSEAAFLDRYKKFCKRHGYIFQANRAIEIYQTSCDLIAMLPKDNMTKLLIIQAIDQLNTISKTVENLRQQMDQLAQTLPEYEVVLSMNGVGKSLGPQLIAEIGDVTRFNNRTALTAFAGVDPGANQSGKYEAQSSKTSKRGSPHLRRTLFRIMQFLIMNKPQDDAVYRFIDKKRSEGKPYYVYMTAGANKFLRIYYARVRQYLESIKNC